MEVEVPEASVRSTARRKLTREQAAALPFDYQVMPFPVGSHFMRLTHWELSCVASLRVIVCLVVS